MHLGYLAPTLFFGGASALGFWLAQRKARKVKFFQQEELEVSQVKAGGVCKVHGLVATTQPIPSPLTGKPCVWYRMLVQEYVNAGRASRWTTIHDEATYARFQLKDRKGPGTIEVDPAGAEVVLAGEGGTEDHARWCATSSRRERRECSATASCARARPPCSRARRSSCSAPWWRSRGATR